MKFLRGIVVFILVFVLFCIGFVDGLVWTPGFTGDCDDSEILNLWDEVFIESSDGAVILKDFVAPEGDCDEYIVYKNDSGGNFWVIYGNFYDNFGASSEDLYFSGRKILNFVNLSFYYGNFSSGFLENFAEQTNISIMKDLILNLGEGEVEDWVILSENEVKNKFDDLYGFVNLSSISFNSNSLSFYFNEIDDFTWDSFSLGLVCQKNKALFSGVYTEIDYDPSFFVKFNGVINNFTFFENSSWNFAFDYTDYFNVSENISVDFDYVGENNVDGKYINYSFDGTNVFFAPAIGFKGWRKFRLVANGVDENVFSNYFIINITRYNKKPVLDMEFPYFYIVAGGEKIIDLDYYFSDDDLLSFGVDNIVADSRLKINFNGPYMRIRANDDFSDYVKFKIYAFDGIAKTLSNYIYIFLEGVEVTDEILNSIDDNDTINLSKKIDNKSNDTGGGFSEIEDNDGIFWGLIIVVSILVFVFIVVVFVYFLLSKGGENVSNELGDVVSQGRNLPTQDYIKKLGLNKK